MTKLRLPMGASRGYYESVFDMEILGLKIANMCDIFSPEVLIKPFMDSELFS
jgi:hypothetical protein